jgi:hypothetical protein
MAVVIPLTLKPLIVLLLCFAKLILLFTYSLFLSLPFPPPSLSFSFTSFSPLYSFLFFPTLPYSLLLSNSLFISFQFSKIVPEIQHEVGR